MKAFFDKLLKGIEQAFSTTNGNGQVMWYIPGVPPMIIVQENKGSEYQNEK